MALAQFKIFMTTQSGVCSSRTVLVSFSGTETKISDCFSYPVPSLLDLRLKKQSCELVDTPLTQKLLNVEPISSVFIHLQISFLFPYNYHFLFLPSKLPNFLSVRKHLTHGSTGCVLPFCAISPNPKHFFYTFFAVTVFSCFS